MGFRRRCCVGCLYGTFNVDTGFKADYLIELEKISGFGWDEHRQLVVAEDVV
ncbi:hypothetical protein Goklo_020953 [Gossypium klotzschianum]|uniref:Myb/SANT-like domain-containing protein n=1 Tax=Gossypium klotzschianum TaxID=34286 RepID=A0A7J8UTZ4_9ROSI|nr:hypothetical protein [Gossypium klotzschianum]